VPSVEIAKERQSEAGVHFGEDLPVSSD